MRCMLLKQSVAHLLNTVGHFGQDPLMQELLTVVYTMYSVHIMYTCILVPSQLQLLMTYPDSRISVLSHTALSEVCN